MAELFRQSKATSQRPGAHVGLPAPKHWALAIRRHRMLDLSLDAYDRSLIDVVVQLSHTGGERRISDIDLPEQSI